MRLGAWLAIVAFTLGSASTLASCSGGYPLAPTRCDEWCDATRSHCEYYDPAGCVSSCEAGGMDNETCRPQLDAVIRCYRSNPSASANLCFSREGGPCAVENTALGECTFLRFQSSAPQLE
jgi:hypothetical protein